MRVTISYLLKYTSDYGNIDIPENKISSDDSCRVPPVPIPNTVVKPTNAEGTWLETAWEIRKLLVRLDIRYSTYDLRYNFESLKS